MLKDLFMNSISSCDKFDHYFDLYEQWLSKFVGKSPRILEIGVQYGGSAELWRKYFGEGTHIEGIDIDPQCNSTEYLNITIGDQGSELFWDSVNFEPESFDIVIDDGSHENAHQILTLQKTYKFLKNGGVFWCEDTHTSYYKDRRVKNGGYLNPESFTEYCKRVLDVVNMNHTTFVIGSGPTPDGPHVDAELVSLYKNISGIHFYDSIVVIEKNKRTPLIRHRKLNGENFQEVYFSEG